MNVVSFYRFVDIAAAEVLQRELQSLCDGQGLFGTILIAGEGVNGTLAGDAAAINAVFDVLRSRLSLDRPIEGRWTLARGAPFQRMKVRLKQEIVALGRPDIRPQDGSGRHVPPAGWNALIDDPRTLVIDTRNHYEVSLGTFPRALDPGTDSFRQFPAFAETLPAADRNRPVAMFCTGGIRCEKASALLKELGFPNVHQLQGGILNYLEQTDDATRRWSGDCFVFDSRVAVDRDLAEGGYEQCHACRRPLSTADLAAPGYRQGVSCPHCVNDAEPERGSELPPR